ncbi:MAG: DUF2892 domain-containing protein [Ignavibacteriae bacterium]|nr:DUF2892 domain-containing protein [Ignavibacteriota bacterium]
MNKNVGTIDKGIRILLAITIAVLYFTGTLSGTTAIILGILAVIFIATSFAGTCPIYSICRISTTKKSTTK